VILSDFQRSIFCFFAVKMARKRKMTASEVLNAIQDSTNEDMVDSDYQNSDDFESEKDSDFESEKDRYAGPGG